MWHDKPPQETHYAGHEAEHINARKYAGNPMMQTFGSSAVTVTGECCGCPAPMIEVESTEHDYELGTMVTRTVQVPDPSWINPAPTRPAIVLDPFGGTGTTALMADVLGRHGVSVDMSADYCRLAAWRTTDPGERARAMQVDKPEPIPDGQLGLFA